MAPTIIWPAYQAISRGGLLMADINCPGGTSCSAVSSPGGPSMVAATGPGGPTLGGLVVA